MNAHPHSVQLAPVPEAPARPEPSRFAQNLMQSAKTLVPQFEAGKLIDAAALRAAMEDAFGASDTSGAWVWKDAYEAAEIAQILILSRYGALMQRQAASPQAFLTMIERLAGLAPSHTRRSEDSVRLQQFSTPLPLAAIVAQAAGFRADDLVLEPSAGTGLLAIFARIAGTRLALNELAKTRRASLGDLFPAAVVSDHDAASIDDRLDRSITPSVIVMNPPFSAANHVEGRFRQATSQHVLSALARLAPGGRLVVITGESFRPSTKSFQSTFQRIASSADVVFSAAIDGKVFARHGTTIDTRLTVIDKRVAGAKETAPVENEAAYHPLCATTGDLLASVLTHCPERRTPPPCPTSSALSVPSGLTRTNLHALRNAARKETRALAEERAKHPFDDIETAPLDYLPKAWSEPEGALQDTVYEAYDLQAIRIDGAAVHPTALVQSAAMASVPPPVPTYCPLLPKNLVADGLLSAPQLESVIYAGNAHETHLKGWFKRGEIEGQLMAAVEGDESAFRLRKGWFLGDGTGCGKGRQVAGIILDNWLQGRRRAVWVSKSDKLIEDALLAKITDNRGQITGCARVYLDPSTGGLAGIESPKRILGQLHGHAIRFWSGTSRGDLIVGEGLENTLSVGTALPEFDLASCLTATHLGLFVPPPGIKRIWIARDNDEAGRNASKRLRNQLESPEIAGGDLVPQLGDFNDDLRANGRDALRRSLLRAMKAQGLGIEDG